MTGFNFTITFISEEDIPGFHATLDRVAKEKKYLDFMEAPPLEATRAFILNNIKRDHAQFVARVDGKVVGWCDIIPSQKGAAIATAHVGVLGVGILPEYRGKGIGRQLIQAAIEKAARQGLTRIELNAREHNTNAIGLYKKLGFEIEGLKRNAAKVNGVYENYYLMALLVENT